MTGSLHLVYFLSGWNCASAATREAILKYFERCSDHPLGLDHMYLTLHDAVLHSTHLPMTPVSRHWLKLKTGYRYSPSYRMDIALVTEWI